VVPPCSGILWPPRAQNVLCRVALTCSHCDVVNQTMQFRRIRYWSAVALSSPMWQITADVPVSDVRHRYRSDTSFDDRCVPWNKMIILEAVHYFTTITIFMILAVILYIRFTTTNVQVVCRSTLLLRRELWTSELSHEY